MKTTAEQIADNQLMASRLAVATLVRATPDGRGGYWIEVYCPEGWIHYTGATEKTAKAVVEQLCVKFGLREVAP